EFRDRAKSPLEPDAFARFEGHDFFPIDLNYRVKAKLAIAEGTPFFNMKTTTSRFSTERVYGYVTFTLSEKEFRLPVYQSKDLMQTKEYADYLFFPFTDETNGKETYGGGRYIDLRIPKEGDNVVIDFNMAYNPYCAYSSRFSCPLVPAENQLDIQVPAGVRYHKKEEKLTPDPTLPDSTTFSKPDVPPEFPGGYEALYKFISSNMIYPRAAVEAKTQGSVYVQFVVAADGSITDVRTVKGLSRECDQEAERVVSLMPKWKPGKINGKAVFVRYILPVKFKGQAGWNKQ
ncbi:MAG TPA: TonB family protein, partial [Chryseosolibacter sp.]